MSAIELLEQLGASATLNRNPSEYANQIRQQAIDALNELDMPRDKQWCVLVPAEEEPTEQPSDDDDAPEEKDESTIRFN